MLLRFGPTRRLPRTGAIRLSILSSVSLAVISICVISIMIVVLVLIGVGVIGIGRYVGM